MFGVMHLRLTEAAQKGAHDALLCRGGAHTIPTITPAAVDSAHTGKSSGLPPYDGDSLGDSPTRR